MPCSLVLLDIRIMKSSFGADLYDFFLCWFNNKLCQIRFCPCSEEIHWPSYGWGTFNRKWHYRTILWMLLGSCPDCYRSKRLVRWGEAGSDVSEAFNDLSKHPCSQYLVWQCGNCNGKNCGRTRTNVPSCFGWQLQGSGTVWLLYSYWEDENGIYLDPCARHRICVAGSLPQV